MVLNESSTSSDGDLDTRKFNRTIRQNAQENSSTLTIYVLTLIPFILYLIYGLMNEDSSFSGFEIYDIVFASLFMVVIISSIISILIQNTPLKRKLLPNKYDDFQELFTDRFLIPFLVIVGIISFGLFVHAVTLSNEGVELLLGQPIYMMIILAIFSGIISIFPLMMYPILKYAENRKNSQDP